MEETKPVCQWDVDADGRVSFEQVAESAGKCSWDPRAKSFVLQSTVVDKHGHPLDGDDDPHATNGCDHRDSPEWIAEHQEQVMAEQAKQAPVAPAPVKHVAAVHAPAPAPVAHEEAPAAPALAPDGIAPPAAPVTQAVVEQPAQDASSQLMALAGQKDISPMAIGAGIVALGGSGAMLKFFKNMLDSKRATAEKQSEQDFELKKMELEQRKSQSEDQHKACSAGRLALEAQVAAIQADLRALTEQIRASQSRVDAVAAKLEKMTGDGDIDLSSFDPEKLEKSIKAIDARIKKIEKASQAPAKK